MFQKFVVAVKDRIGNSVFVATRYFRNFKYLQNLEGAKRFMCVKSIFVNNFFRIQIVKYGHQN